MISGADEKDEAGHVFIRVVFVGDKAVETRPGVRKEGTNVGSQVAEKYKYRAKGTHFCLKPRNNHHYSHVRLRANRQRRRMFLWPARPRIRLRMPESEQSTRLHWILGFGQILPAGLLAHACLSRVTYQ